MATDLAEFLGAALGFYLLFGIPMLRAAIVTGVCVMLILAVEQLGFQWLERLIMLFVGLIGISYAIEMFLTKSAWTPLVKNVLVPEVHSGSLTRRKDWMGAYSNHSVTNYLATAATIIILAMNAWLLFAIATGKS